MSGVVTHVPGSFYTVLIPRFPRGGGFFLPFRIAADNDGYQRFSIAHELGHFFVEGHLDYIPFVHGVHRSRAGYISQDRYEREADCFAAGLLIPEAPVCEVIGR